MAHTQWGIVYGTANPFIMMHILPDDDSELDAPHWVTPGKTKMVKIPIIEKELPADFNARAATAVCKDAGVTALTSMSFTEILPDGSIQMHNGDPAFFQTTNTVITHIGPGVSIV